MHEVKRGRDADETTPVEVIDRMEHEETANPTMLRSSLMLEVDDRNIITRASSPEKLAKRLEQEDSSMQTDREKKIDKKVFRRRQKAGKLPADAEMGTAGAGGAEEPEGGDGLPKGRPHRFALNHPGVHGASVRAILTEEARLEEEERQRDWERAQYDVFAGSFRGCEG